MKKENQKCFLTNWSIFPCFLVIYDRVSHPEDWITTLVIFCCRKPGMNYHFCIQGKKGFLALALTPKSCILGVNNFFLSEIEAFFWRMIFFLAYLIFRKKKPKIFWIFFLTPYFSITITLLSSHFYELI